MDIGGVYEATAGECTELHSVATGMFDVANYGTAYVLAAERPAIIETGIGTNYERLLDAVRAVGLDPADIEVIAVTHVHLDHAGGAGFLLDACPNAAVYVHEIGAPHLVDPTRLWEGTERAVGDQFRFYTEPRPIPGDRLIELTDGDTIELGDHALAAHHAPGHAPHQVVFYDPSNDALFTGDAAGLYIPESDELFPTSPPPNFDPDGAQADIGLLETLDPGVVCYTHVGAVETGDKFGRYAEVLSEWVDDVASKRHELEDDEAVIEHFVSQADAERAVWGAEKAEGEVAMNVRGVLHALDEE